MECFLLCLWVSAALPASAACLFPGDTAAAAPQEQKPSSEEKKPPAAPAPTPAPPPSTPGAEAQVVGVAPPSKAQEKPGEWFLEWKYAVNATDLKGNAERSFLNEGVNHIFDFSYFNKRKLLGGRQLESLGVFRYTDDPRVDPERNSFQRGYARLTGSTFDLTLGDHLVNYSRFSFNQNVKGVSLRKELKGLGGLRLTGTGGVFTDRWGALFRGFEAFAGPRTVPDPRFPSKPYTRAVLGLRGEKPLGENKWVAFNFSQGYDIVRTLPRQAEIPPFNNQVLSSDWLLLFRRNLRLAGEVAYSFTRFDSSFQENKKGDYAVRVELSQEWHRYRWRAEYLRFMPNFLSVNARQVQDLQDISVRGTVDLTAQLSLTAGYRRTNDNLSGNPVVRLIPRRVCNDADLVFRPQPLSNPNRTLTVCDPVTGDLLEVRSFDHVVDPVGNGITTVLRAPEIRLIVRSLPFWRRLVLEFGYRERVVETSNKDSFRITTQASSLTPSTVSFLTPLFRQRATKIPYFNLSLPLGIHLINLSYEYRHNRDHVRPGDSTFTHRLAGQYRLPSVFVGEWTFSGNVGYETERESKQIELATLTDPLSQLPVVDPLTLQPIVSRKSGGDQTRTLSGNFQVQFPKYFILELLYREFNAKLFSGFQLGAERLFGDGGYRRPHMRAQLEYHIANKENIFLLFTLERNVNTFRIPDRTQPDARSFRENVAQITFVWRLRR